MYGVLPLGAVSGCNANVHLQCISLFASVMAARVQWGIQGDAQGAAQRYTVN